MKKIVKKRRVIILMIFSLLLFLPFISSLPIQVKPLTATGQLQPNTAFIYEFNFTTDQACTNVVLTNTSTITTGVDGIGFIDLDISSATSPPSYLCETRDSVFRKAIPISSQFFNNNYFTGLVGINTTNPSSVLDIVGTTTFNSGWTSGGASIIDGDGYFQNLYAVSLYGLNVTTLNTNGSIIPSLDNIFDIGNSTNRWKNLYIGTGIVNNGTSYLMGNVGIGTSSPGYNLDVTGTMRATTSLNTPSISSTYIRGSEFYYHSGNGGMVVSYDDVYFRNHNLDKTLYIDGGNYATGQRYSRVGIGVDLTTPNSTLHIKGYGSNSSTSSLNVVNNDSTSMFYVRDDGLVGINTSSPVNTLNVIGDGNFTGNLYSNGALVGAGSISSNGTANYISKFVNSTYLTNSSIYESGGNVGIGTSSPSESLETKGKIKLSNDYSTAYIELDGGSADPGKLATITMNRWGVNRQNEIIFSTGSPNWYVGSSNSGVAGDGTEFFIGESSGGASPAFWIESGGNVGIGTSSPGATLDVNSSSATIAQFTSTQGQGGWIEFQRSEGTNAYLGSRAQLVGGGFNNDFTIRAENNLTFATNANNERMIIHKNGNVGIGTSSPSALLDINGTVGSIEFDSGGNYQIFKRNSNNYIYADGGSSNLLLGAGNKQFLNLMSTGRVGINTTSPDETLEVFNGNIKIGDNADTSRSLILERNSAAIGYIEALSSRMTMRGASGRNTQVLNWGQSGMVVFDNNDIQFVGTSVHFDNDGSVGIGMTNPETDLGVMTGGSNGFSSGTIPPGITIYGNSADGWGSALVFKPAAGNQGISAIGSFRTSGFETDLRFYTNNVGSGNAFAERMRIDTSGNVGINTTTPQNTLDVVGVINGTSDAIINGVTVGKGANSVASNVVLGINALDASVTGDHNVAIGLYAMTSNTAGQDGVAIGSGAMGENVGGFGNTAIGRNALWANTASHYNVAMGQNAGTYNKGGSNVFLGYSSGYGVYGSSTGSYNTLMGATAGTALTTGGYNTLMGYGSGIALTTGGYNTLIGEDAGKSLTTGTYNVLIGSNVGYDETGSYKIMLDNRDRTSEALGRTNAPFYSVTSATASAQVTQIGGGGNVGINTTTPQNTLNVVGDFNVTSTSTFQELSGTYTNGEAYVCVYDNGTIFAKDSACS